MFPQLLTSLALLIISSALQESARAQPAQLKPPEPGKLDVPTAEEGRPVPVIFGTCMVKSPNVIWYGDSNTSPIKQSAGSTGKK